MSNTHVGIFIYSGIIGFDLIGIFGIIRLDLIGIFVKLALLVGIKRRGETETVFNFERLFSLDDKINLIRMSERIMGSF